MWTEHISTYHKHYDDIRWSIYGAVLTRLLLRRSSHTLASRWQKSELSQIALVAVRLTALCCLYYCVQYALIVALFRWLDCQERASHLRPRNQEPGTRNQEPGARNHARFCSLYICAQAALELVTESLFERV